jgi:hypothetical protein
MAKDPVVIDPPANDKVVDPPAPPPAPPLPPPLDEEQNLRLRELRVQMQNYDPAMTDAEREELQTLGRAEAEAAGHFPPEPTTEATKDSDGMLTMHDDMVGIVRAIVDRVPSLWSLSAMLDRFQAKLDALRNPK